MSNDKSRAERLAEWLDHHGEKRTHSLAASELRRLDAVNRELLKALECLVDCATYGPVSDSADAWDDAHAAIAKATDV